MPLPCNCASQVAFPLPKLDLVAIPNFAAGAMENWGLLMYRERALLVNDSKDDMHQRYAIATTVAHETVRRPAVRSACGSSTVHHTHSLYCLRHFALLLGQWWGSLAQGDMDGSPHMSFGSSDHPHCADQHGQQGWSTTY